jgi:hypothetical protein
MAADTTVRHVIQHGLSHRLAARAARKAVDQLRAEHGQHFSGRWETATVFRFTINLGKAFPGVMSVEPEVLRFSVSEVPFLYRSFAKIAISHLEAGVSEWIDKAMKGELG